MDKDDRQSKAAELAERIAYQEFEIGEVEAGRVKHQTRKGDGPWEDTTDRMLDHHRRTKEMLEGLLKLVSG